MRVRRGGLAGPLARGMLLGVVGLVATGARCVDKEPGFVANLQSSSITVREEAKGPVIAIDIRMKVRVGKHALSGRDFKVPRADLFAGDAAARINLQRPEGFDGTLEPGESQVLSLHGETSPGGFSEAAAALCPDAPTVDVKVDWEAQLRSSETGKLTTMEMGMATDTTDDVSCE